MLQFEWTILHTIQDWFRHDVLDVFMKNFTHIGDAGIIWIIVTICLLISKKYRKVGVLCAIGLILGLIIGNGIVKHLVERQRPCWLDKEFELLIKNPPKWDSSFPSGHTQSAFIMTTILMLANKKFGIPALVVALMIAFSRLYLYVHFPTDILGGMLMGIAIGLTVWFVYKWKFEKKFGPIIEPKPKKVEKKQIEE